MSGPHSISTFLRQGLTRTYPPGPFLVRNYSFSRFPEKGPGTLRSPRRAVPSRRRPVPFGDTISNEFDTIDHDNKSSSEEFNLWNKSQHKLPPAAQEGLRKLLLDNDLLVVTRQLEMLNIFIGFEQHNKYTISNENGEALGYIMEEPRGFLSMFSRQIFRTHRPFRALVMNLDGSPILWLRRPFAWINSRMFVQKFAHDGQDYSEGEPVLDTFAEVQQRWHLWRRKYDLFLRDEPRRILSVISEPQPEPEPNMFRQLAYIDEGFLAWHFKLRDARGGEIANVKRAFRGFGLEIFTDTGQYVIRFGHDPEQPSEVPSVIRSLTLQERALILAMAVNIDFDYFSRHSEHGGTGFFFWNMGNWE